MNQMTGQSGIAEASSGKDARYENFPVGSILLPPELRPHIAVFYAYARAIDDIADSPALHPAEKLRRLDDFADALSTPDHTGPGLEKAHRMRASLQDRDLTNRHCLDLISAFKQDVTKRRYEDWEDLIDYCNRSAAPVGRYLLDLHGESADGYVYSDALCNALQALNHLQDCAEDFLLLDRLYLPLPWFTAHNVYPESLLAPASCPELRQIIDRALDLTLPLIEQASMLPSVLRNRRLAMESAVIIKISRRLAAKLRREDPVAGRVKLSKLEYGFCTASGIGSILLGNSPPTTGADS